MTTAAEIVDGLTVPEKDAVLTSLCIALVRNDTQPNLSILLDDLGQIADMLSLAGASGRVIDIPLSRSYLTSQMVLDIRSAPSAKEASERMGIPASTVRHVRRGASHGEVRAAA